MMRGKLARREAIEAYLYLLPWILGFIFLTGGPYLAGLALGFTDWEAKGSPRFVGLSNFIVMFTSDPLFYQALKVTFLFAAGNLVIGGLLSLGAALLLNQRLPGMHLFRTIYYLPVVVSAVAMSLLWAFALHRDYGVINWLIRYVLDAPGPDWMGSETCALPAMILMSLWGSGNPMIILLAGLKGIPQELYEAAMVDGANAWHRLLSVTLPMLSASIFFNLVTGIIGALQLFTQVYILTSGGPNFATY